MTDLDDLAKLADDLATPQRAASTQRVYATDWRMFTEWCASVGQPTDPATSDTVRLYLVHLLQSDIAYVTMLKKLSSISQALSDAGHPGKSIAWHPTVRRVLAGIKRREDEAGRQAQRAKPLRIPDLRKIGASIDPNTLAGLRDWSLILIQFAGALRRSEVAALELADVTQVSQGLEVRIRRSKRDQAGRGFTIGIPYGEHQETCPVLAWQAWRRVYVADVGIAFPSIDRWDTVKLDADGGAKRMDGRSVSEMLQRRAAAAGLEGNWTGNSARRGFATVAKAEGAGDEQVMRHGRWRWVENMRMYVDGDNVWADAPASRLGL